MNSGVQYMKYLTVFLKKLVVVFMLLSLTGWGGYESDEKKAEQLLEQGVEAIENEKTNEALIWLRKALQENSDLAEAHYQLGRLYRKMGKANLAYTELSRAVSLDRSFKEAKKELAFFLAEQKAQEEALKLCEQYIEAEGRDPDILLIMGNALVFLQRQDEAVNLLRRAVKDYPDNNMMRVSLARALLAAGADDEVRLVLEEMDPELTDDINIRQAVGSLYGQLGLKQLQLKTLEQIKSGFPDEPVSYLSLARFRLQRGEPDKARAVLDEALAAGVETAEIHQMIGIIDHNLKQEDTAELHFKKAVSIADGKSLAGSRLLLVDYYIYRKRFAEAQALLEQCIEQGSTIPAFYYKLIDIYLVQEKFDEAGRFVDELAKKNAGDDALVHFLRGKLLVRDEKIKEARKEFALAGKLDPGSGESQFFYGLTFMGEFDRISMAEISKALEKNPDMMKAHLALAQLYAGEGKMEKALEEIDQVISRQPDNEKARMFRIKVLLQMGKTREALQDGQYLVNRYSDNPGHRFRLAEIYSIAGNMEKAREMYLSLHAQVPDNVQVLGKLVGLYLRTKDFDKAFGAVDRFLEQFPEKMEPLLIKARVYMARQQLNEAEQLLVRAADKDPENPLPLVMLGNLYRMEKDTKRAIEVYNQALVLTPEHTATLMNVADLYMKQGDYSQAIGMYEKILKKADSFLPALNNLLYLYSETGRDMDRGLEIAGKIADMNPQNGAVLDTLGWFYVKQGTYGRAEMYLSRALAGLPDSSSILYHMGVLRYRQKQWKEAASLMQQAMEKGLKTGERMEAEAILARIETVANKVAQCKQLRRSGRHEQAMSILNQLLETEEFNVEVVIVLAEVLGDLKKDLQRATELARRACDAVCATDPRAADALGWIYLRQGTYLLARQYLKQAVDAQPDSPLFRYHYGVLLFENERFAEAEAELEKAVALNLNEYDRRNALELLQKAGGKKEL